MSKKGQNENVYEAAYEEMSKFENYFVGHWTRIAQFCAIFIIVLIAYMLISYFSKGAEARVAGEISKAKTAEEINAILSKHPKHPGADFARMRLARIYFDDKKYEEAAKIYEQLSNSRHEDLALRAKLNFAYVLEAQDKKSEAAAKFQGLSGLPSCPEEIRFEAAYSAARIYSALGEKEKALANLDTIIGKKDGDTEKKDSFWNEKAEQLKKTLN